MSRYISVIFACWAGLYLFLPVAGHSAGMLMHGDGLVNHTASKSREKAEGPGKIKIGLLLPQPPEEDQLALSSWQGARLAITEANQKGGFNGTPFELVVRTTEGLWGAGSKEAVKLVYEDEVTAIITALDGRNAHLAEQVAAKAQVVQVAARASDETLSQAYVPWFFRIVPDDRQQAMALIHEIKNKKHNRLSVIYRDDYDYKMAAETFKKLALKEGLTISGSYSFGEPGSRDEQWMDTGDFGEAMIVFSDYGTAKKVLERVNVLESDIQIYGNLYMTMDGRISSEWIAPVEGAVCVSSRFCFSTPGQPFKKSFFSQYNRMPDPAVSYAYDAVNLIIEAIQKAGPDKQGIRDVLSEINYPEGVTGSISFDELGNRTSSVFLIKVIKGHPVILP